ncbi:MYXO-CTERM sorting domain-containing protein [Bacillus cytotoxicus]|uniref:MYXO-CTERM sorting domain-containing protein n=1 Tax=Bacillus cytotoxicus TaxID=580165 RepID=UPI000D6419BB
MILLLKTKTVNLAVNKQRKEATHKSVSPTHGTAPFFLLLLFWRVRRRRCLRLFFFKDFSNCTKSSKCFNCI